MSVLFGCFRPCSVAFVYLHVRERVANARILWIHGDMCDMSWQLSPFALTQNLNPRGCRLRNRPEVNRKRSAQDARPSITRKCPCRRCRRWTINESIPCSVFPPSAIPSQSCPVALILPRQTALPCSSNEINPLKQLKPVKCTVPRIPKHDPARTVWLLVCHFVVCRPPVLHQVNW